MNRKKNLEELITSFFEKHCQDVIPLSDYVIDFAVLPNTHQVLIVELNPFVRNHHYILN